jgi:hypothetical protein
MPRKKVVEPAPEPLIPEGENEERWPQDVIEKHHQRQEAAKKIFALKAEQKRQRLIRNGVPAEKRPI